MRSIYPLTNPQQYVNGSSGTLTGLTPTVNTWDYTSNPLTFSIHVPQGERWLTHFHIESYIQGPNAPTYQTAFGIVLRGSTSYSPALWGGPGSYWHPINTAGDAAWGSTSIPIWLNPGITVCHFGYARDAGAVTLMRRLIQGLPYLGMKI